MQKVWNLIKLMRPKHWLKNGLIALALFFGSRFYLNDILTIVFGIISFCLISSAVYVLNDICDVSSDRLHDVKKHRPIASGAISIKFAYFWLAILLVGVIAIDIMFSDNLHTFILIILYFILNVGYSLKLKQLPITDVLILASGFVIRVFYGAVLIEQPVSNWLLLTTLTMSLYMGFGKRRNELIAFENDGEGSKRRKVLEYYNKGFLDKNMYACMTLTLIFYSLWAMQLSPGYEISLIVLTIPIAIAICLRYSLVTETGRFADPVDVLLGDKVLMVLALVYGGLVLLFFI